MAAVSGVRRERLQPLIDEVNAGLDAGAPASVALVNTPRRMIVAGPPATLALLRARLAAQAREEQQARRDGLRGGAPLSFGWSGLDADVAFHTAALAEPCEELVRRLHADPTLVPDPQALTLPVLSPVDGRDLRSGGDLARAIASALLVEPVRWDVVSHALAEHGADWVLDLGPGTDVAALTAENLRGARRAHARAGIAGGAAAADVAGRLARRAGHALRELRARPSSSCPAGGGTSTAATRASPAARR